MEAEVFMQEASGARHACACGGDVRVSEHVCQMRFM